VANSARSQRSTLCPAIGFVGFGVSVATSNLRVRKEMMWAMSTGILTELGSTSSPVDLPDRGAVAG
jgi:hypothetical protein